ncbi:hypothetical protein F5Y15DRAFT_57923 [Xylariaceae sp. FL0016]|nr:hypothetical protein F5Y15DRAFT_57923 [Xylariaceae sp. FL0016]
MSALMMSDGSAQADEYARNNGLFIDSQTDPFHIALQHDFNPSQPRSCTSSTDPSSDTSLPVLRLPVVNLDREKLTTSRQSIALLNDMLRRDNEKNEFSISKWSYDDLRTRKSRLKMEPPALQSDIDYECRELERTIRRRRSTALDPDIFPLENACAEEPDLPSSAYKLKECLDSAVRDEKLDVTRDTVLHIAQSLRVDWTEDDQQRLVAEQALRHPNFQRSLTPPLSPRIRVDYFVPSDAVCQVPIASDTSTLLDKDVESAENGLSPCKNLHGESSCIVDIDLPQLSPLEHPKYHGFSPLKRDSVKIEVPLRPINERPHEPPPIDIPRLATSMDIDHILDQHRVLESHEGEDSGCEDVLVMMRDENMNINRIIEQECLETTNARARFAVPIRDFSIPPDESENMEMSSADQLTYILQSYNGFDLLRFPKYQKGERELIWTPFKHTTDLYDSLGEHIDEDDQTRGILDSLSPEDVPNSGNFVWKQPGLAILLDPEDDDELQATVLEQPVTERQNMGSIPKKRGHGIYVADTPSSDRENLSPIDLLKIPTREASKLYAASTDKSRSFHKLLPESNDPAATTTLLSNYIHIHTAKKQKQSQSIFFKKTTDPDKEPRTASAAVPANSQSRGQHSDAVEHHAENARVEHATFPVLELPRSPTKIIKALTLSRGLFSRLERLYSNAQVIERDFDRWNTLSWNHYSVVRSPVISPLASEADIIISPATGLVLTSLLKVRQKPPRGKEEDSALRMNIVNVAKRYERLIVLVSEGNGQDESARDLSSSECQGFADFAGFVASLDTNGQVFYVGGGEDTLARWMVHVAITHAHESSGVQDLLIEDESVWELFLRRAGMNVYAAQAILGYLRAPDGVTDEERAQYGLPAFIRMAPKERIRRFGGILGGTKVLNRVNQVLLTQWNSPE